MRFALAALVLASAASASAGVSGVNVEYVTPGPASLANFTSNDILIDFDTSALRGQQIFLTLTSGTIYNTPGTGSNTPPNDAFLVIVPELAFDTFVGIGGRSTGSVASDTLVVGGAVNIPGAPGALTMTDAQTLSVAFAPAPGNNIAPADNFFVSRITLSNDANGTFTYFGTTDGSADATFEIPVINGRIGVPEPASALLIGLATCGLAAVRTRG
ncbi:hypothetical protein [Botrimarina hoheduenensis]|uniref:PEP-CTERM protein-sorting domain-containing protein n=1 Tax=Botrimarina hoheduenensis TaxID=2528000 RepID=A0A5C5VZT8_9BACT|nr:hypothetical protein [Botrimarina hoheduenensis]TWT43435.1 hypothetical protein Pla111_23860 [Botrimarina hoheduenensis]